MMRLAEGFVYFVMAMIPMVFGAKNSRFKNMDFDDDESPLGPLKGKRRKEVEVALPQSSFKNQSFEILPKNCIFLIFQKFLLHFQDYAYYDDPSLQLQWSSIIPSVTDLNKLPECQKQCTSHFSETLQMALKHGTHYERFHNVCK